MKQTITLRNKELHRLNILLGILLALVVFISAQAISNWFYLGFILVVLTVCKTSGVQFDPKRRTYRSYNHVCFWTSGNWKPIGANKCLVILVKHGVKSTTGTMMTHTMKTKGGFSELYLMDENHIKRFFVHSSENHEEMEELALKLSDSLHLEVQPYRPRNKG